MIRVAHLLDDFGMGGVTRALTVFEEPALTRISTSKVVPISPEAVLAPKIEADLIVDHMTFSWKRLAFLMSLRARNPRTRIVHVEHSYTYSFEDVNVEAKRRFRTMLGLASLLVNEIVCVSSAQHAWLANCVGINPNMLSIIYPWTDRKELLAVPPKRQGIDLPIKLLAYGRYAPVKNFAELISAMRYLPSGLVELTVFGDGPERSLLQSLAADLPNVEVRGPSNSPKAHLENCDAVIIPSRYEAFGLVATEARMAGRAILVAKVDGLPEQARHGGHVAPMRTAYEIASAIRQFAHFDLARMGNEARRKVNGQSEEILLRWCRIIERAKAKSPPEAGEFSEDQMLQFNG